MSKWGWKARTDQAQHRWRDWSSLIDGSVVTALRRPMLPGKKTAFAACRSEYRRRRREWRPSVLRLGAGWQRRRAQQREVFFFLVEFSSIAGEGVPRGPSVEYRSKKSPYTCQKPRREGPLDERHLATRYFRTESRTASGCCNVQLP